MRESGLGSLSPDANSIFESAVSAYRSDLDRERVNREESQRRRQEYDAKLQALPRAIDRLRASIPRFDEYLRGGREQEIVVRLEDDADLALTACKKREDIVKRGTVLASYSPEGLRSDVDNWESFSVALFDGTCAVVVRRLLKIHGVYLVLPKDRMPDGAQRSIDRFVDLVLACVDGSGAVVEGAALDLFRDLFTHRSPCDS